MKNVIIGCLLLTILAGCSSQVKPDAADMNESGPPDTITALDEGVWPVNAYTDGLPVPTGAVNWAVLDTEHENCTISLTDMSETDYSDYMELLKQEGFCVVAAVSEEIKGQDYVSEGTLLSDGEKELSISYIPDHFTIFISCSAD